MYVFYDVENIFKIMLSLTYFKINLKSFRRAILLLDKSSPSFLNNHEVIQFGSHMDQDDTRP